MQMYLQGCPTSLRVSTPQPLCAEWAAADCPPHHTCKHGQAPACSEACNRARARLHGVVGEQLGEAPCDRLLAFQAPPSEQQQLGARGPDQPQRALRACAHRPGARLRALQWTL